MSEYIYQPNDITTAALPDGSHVIYCQASDGEGEDLIYFKIVRSIMDLQTGEWQKMSLKIKDK